MRVNQVVRLIGPSVDGVEVYAQDIQSPGRAVDPIDDVRARPHGQSVHILCESEFPCGGPDGRGLVGYGQGLSDCERRIELQGLK